MKLRDKLFEENKEALLKGDAVVANKIEKELIKQILEITNGKKVETAEILGITRKYFKN